MVKGKYTSGLDCVISLFVARSIGAPLAFYLLLIVAFESSSDPSTTTVKSLYGGAHHVRVSRQSWPGIREIVLSTQNNHDTVVKIDGVFTHETDVPNLAYDWHTKADDCEMCVVASHGGLSSHCFLVIQAPCSDSAAALKADVSLYLQESSPEKIDLATPGAFSSPLLSNILNLDRAERINYGGTKLIVQGGSWQELLDGTLAQTDSSAPVAAALAAAGIRGKAEYAFELSYIAGLEDNAIGFGAIVPGFAMGLVWDPANWGGSGLRAQVYNAHGDLHQYGGVTYDFEVPAEIVERINAEVLMNNPLEIRIRVDSSNGDVWVKDPFDRTRWWAFTLGQSIEDNGHNMIGFGTTSGAASFGKFSATPLP